MSFWQDKAKRKAELITIEIVSTEKVNLKPRWRPRVERHITVQPEDLEALTRWKVEALLEALSDHEGAQNGRLTFGNRKDEAKQYGVEGDPTALVLQGGKKKFECRRVGGNGIPDQFWDLLDLAHNLDNGPHTPKGGSRTGSWQSATLTPAYSKGAVRE